jgi:hypothetical protein
MKWMKSLVVCLSIVLFGNVGLLARAQAQEAVTPPKAEPKAAEKSPLVEGSNRAKTESSATEFCQCVGRDVNSASSKKIEQALAGPLHSSGLNYADTSLQDVLMQLGDEYGIPIQLDKVALEEAGIGTDSPVTMTLHNISLHSALRLILHRLQLTWMVRDEVLMVTTKESAEKDLDTCVYNVQGLVEDSDPKSVKALMDVICGCVQTDTWAVNGGGQAEILPLPSGLLVVSQTQAAQEQVSMLLNKIRKMREKAPATKVGPRGYEPPPSRSNSSSAKQTKK